MDRTIIGRLISALRADATLAMATRATQGAVMGLGAAIVIWRMSSTGQGYYFAFISFGILLQLCDFGLSYASLQAASHLLAIGRVSALKALADRALRINAPITAAASIVVAGLGWWLFVRAPDESAEGWTAAWFVFIAGVGINHLTAPYIFIVEGGLSVARAWRFRLAQEIASGVVLLVVLAFGQGLWALAAYFWARFAFAAGWMRRMSLSVPDVAGFGEPMRSWREDLWPFQWRVGLSAIASYLVFQAFGPILFALRGPDAAGRFALSLSVMNAIVMVTTAWPISQAAHFGVLVGRRQVADLARRWTQLLVRSTAFAAVGAVATVAAFVVLSAMAPAAMARFAGPQTTALLIASAVAHHVIACISVVLRSERRDPLLGLSIVGGLATLGLMTVAAVRGELQWVALTYLLCTVATIPIATLVYRRFAARQRLPQAA
ncbi:MAG: hypothetical protein ABI277_18090 [Burkholderiaceae bacterium]